jgi:hypothetical protein
MIVRGWRFVTLLLVALVTGLAAAQALERFGAQSFDSATYITVQKAAYLAWEPRAVGRLLEPVAIVATIVLAVLLRARRVALWLSVAATLALLGAYPVAFYTWVEPVNRVFMAATPGAPPANWTVLRDQWAFGAAIRCACELVALCALLLSAVIDAQAERTQTESSYRSDAAQDRLRT